MAGPPDSPLQALAAALLITFMLPAAPAQALLSASSGLPEKPDIPPSLPATPQPAASIPTDGAEASQILPLQATGSAAGFTRPTLRATSGAADTTGRSDFLIPLTEELERELERILDRESFLEEAPDAEELMHRLEALRAEPVQVNRAGVEELMQVPELSGTLAGAIVTWREENRPFESLDELTEVRGIGPATLQRIRPWLTVGTRSELRRDYYLNPAAWLHDPSTEVVSRFQQPLDLADGYRTPDSLGGYRGGPEALYQRIHFRSNHVSAGLIRNKRSGERAAGFAGPDAGPIHLALHEIGHLQTLVVGDYRIRFGQGLILGDGSGFGKGRDVIRSANRASAGIRGHTSTQTAHAFRGAAATWGEQWRLSTFWSAAPRSATEVAPDTIRMPARNPVYRTTSQQERRHNTRQRTAGVRISRSLEPGQIGPLSGRLGLSGWHNRFDRPVQPGSAAWQLHDPQGRDSRAVSADMRLGYGPAQWFGEAARSGNGGWAALAGVELIAAESTRLTISRRHYGRRFQSLFGDAFSEQSSPPGNEQGWYLGVRHRFSPRLELRGYADQFTFPGPRFRTRRPSHGFEWMVSADWRIDRRTELSTRVRQKVRGEEYTAKDRYGEPVRLLDSQQRTSVRVQLGRQLQPSLRVRGRLEAVQAEPAGAESSTGWMGWADLRIDPLRSLRLELRVARFRTGGYTSRVYMSENDLLYAFTSTMLYGRGERFYLLTRYRTEGRLQLWFKVGVTLYRDRNGLGSGPAHIPGSRRSDIGLQARWSL